MNKHAFTGMMMSMSLVGAAALPACTSQVQGEDSAGGPTSSSNENGSSSEGGVSPNACDKYRDGVTAGKAVVTVKNSRSTPIYVDTYACDTNLSIAVPGHKPETAQLRDEYFEVTCERMMDGVVGPSAYDCLEQSYASIAPGASIEVSWSGLVYESVADLPAACIPNQGAGWNYCVHPKAPPIGSLEAHVRLAGSCTNFNGSTCTGPADYFDATQTFNYPNDKQVLIEVK